MIKFEYLFFMLVLLFASSCTKDFSDNIVGTWTLESTVISDCPEEGIPAANINATNGCIDFFEDQICITVIMKDDNTGTLTFVEEGDPDVTEFTYTTDNELEKAVLCNQGDCRNVTLTDDKLILEGEEDGCPIFFHFIKSS